MRPPLHLRTFLLFELTFLIASLLDTRSCQAVRACCGLMGCGCRRTAPLCTHSMGACMRLRPEAWMLWVLKSGKAPSAPHHLHPYPPPRPITPSYCDSQTSGAREVRRQHQCQLAHRTKRHACVSYMHMQHTGQEASRGCFIHACSYVYCIRDQNCMSPERYLPHATLSPHVSNSKTTWCCSAVQ